MWKLVFIAVAVTALAACSDDAEKSRDQTPSSVTPKGTPAGPETKSTVGASGGTVTSADGRLEVVIPPGALPGDTDITLQPITGTAPGALGGGYRLAKADTSDFVKPVDVRFHLTASEVSAAAPALLGVAWQLPDDTWEKPASKFDAASGVVSASTTHFSDWSAVAGLQLTPASGSVRVSETLKLGVRYCRWTKESEDVLCGIGEPCKVNACVDDQLTGVSAKDWSVNGVAGGTDSTGHVQGSGEGATFTAPAKVPASVSAPRGRRSWCRTSPSWTR
jgi:hypothetical protein